MVMVPKEFCEYSYAELTDIDHAVIKQKVSNGMDFDKALDSVRKVIGFTDTRTGKFYPKEPTENSTTIKSDCDDGISEVDIGGAEMGDVGLGNWGIDFDNETEFDIG